MSSDEVFYRGAALAALQIQSVMLNELIRLKVFSHEQAAAALSERIEHLVTHRGETPQDYRAVVEAARFRLETTVEQLREKAQDDD